MKPPTARSEGPYKSFFLARGKQAHDKRDALRRKDIERETRQAVKDRR